MLWIVPDTSRQALRKAELVGGSDWHGCHIPIREQFPIVSVWLLVALEKQSPFLFWLCLSLPHFPVGISGLGS